MPDQNVIEEFRGVIDIWKKDIRLEKERWKMAWEKRNENWGAYWKKRIYHAKEIALFKILIQTHSTLLMKVVKEAGLLYCRKCNLVFTPDNLPLVIKTEASKKRRHYSCPECSSNLLTKLLS